ncbi:MAG: lipocalin family protein [Rikenellaceae bacterium]
MKTLLFIIFSFFCTSFINAKKTYVDATVVDSLDLERYMGVWYELVRFDTWFEKDVNNVTAVYTLKDNGRVKVENYSTNLQGQKKKSCGRLKRNKIDNSGKLRVAFFLWFYSDYNVLEIDEAGYSYVVIGSDDGKFFWVLSRTPTMDYKVLNTLLRRAERRGYDLRKLVFCAHNESF